MTGLRLTCALHYIVGRGDQVADELVTELQILAAAGQAEGMGNNVRTPLSHSPCPVAPGALQSSSSSSPSSSQKNIRRRVYDALNVLMAMDIITKEKKEIRWVGLPTHSKQDLHKLEVRRRLTAALIISTVVRVRLWSLTTHRAIARACASTLLAVRPGGAP